MQKSQLNFIIIILNFDVILKKQMTHEFFIERLSPLGEFIWPQFKTTRAKEPVIVS